MDESSNYSKLKKLKTDLKKVHSFKTMKNIQRNLSDLFVSANSFDFDIFNFCEELGRPHTVPHLLMHLIDNLPNKEDNFGNFNENKLVLFLNEI